MAKKTIRLTESELVRLVKRAARKMVNEISGQGWDIQFDEDDWVPVNSPEDGHDCYKIKIWPGSGDFFDAFKAYANSGEQALECLVVYLEKKGDNSYFTDDWHEEEEERLRREGYSEEEIADEMERDGDIYIDATMEGASRPHYLRGENLRVKKCKNELDESIRRSIRRYLR